MSEFRIQHLSSREAGERPKGYHNSYRFLRDDASLYLCHAYHWCMKECEFEPLDNAQATSFILKPSRRFMPFTWIVEEKDGGTRCGTLVRKLFGKVDWKIMDAQGQPIAIFKGFYERRFWLIRFIGFFIGDNLPYRYEVLSNGSTLATMERELRPQEPNSESKKGFFSKMVNKILVEKDWVIREEAGREGQVDHRLLISGVVLLDQISRDISAAE